jgi:hypothetical protein
MVQTTDIIRFILVAAVTSVLSVGPASAGDPKRDLAFSLVERLAGERSGTRLQQGALSARKDGPDDISVTYQGMGGASPKEWFFARDWSGGKYELTRTDSNFKNGARRLQRKTETGSWISVHVDRHDRDAKSFVQLRDKRGRFLPAQDLAVLIHGWRDAFSMSKVELIKPLDGIRLASSTIDSVVDGLRTHVTKREEKTGPQLKRAWRKYYLANGDVILDQVRRKAGTITMVRTHLEASEKGFRPRLLGVTVEDPKGRRHIGHGDSMTGLSGTSLVHKEGGGGICRADVAKITQASNAGLSTRVLDAKMKRATAGTIVLGRYSPQESNYRLGRLAKTTARWNRRHRK